MILIVGGDSVEAITQRMKTTSWSAVKHWSGRRSRDLQRSLPRDTETVVIMLDRISHTLARKVRAEAGRRGIPVVFMGRKWSSRTGDHTGLSTMRHVEDSRRKERPT